MSGARENTKKISGRWILGGGVALALGALIWILLPGSALPKADTSQATPLQPTLTAHKGTVAQTLRVSGTTLARNSAEIRAPARRGGMRGIVILELTEPGTMVHKGDIIARVDSRSLADRVDDLQSNYVSSLADVKRRKAELQVDAHNLEQEIRLAQSQLDKWKLEAAAAEVRTVVDRELLELGVEESDAVYKQRVADRKFSEISQRADIRDQEITSQQRKLNLDRNQRDLDRCDIPSPIDGMVVREVIIRESEQAIVKAGDQIRPGQPFLKVIDTSKMEIDAKVSQAVGTQMRLGQKATVGLDAYPEVEMTGTVTSIGAMARSDTSSDYVRWIPIRITIDGANPKLLPDLSAWADVAVANAEDVIEVPRTALQEEAGQYYVSVLNGGAFEQRPVTVSLVTSISAAVTSGVEPGEKIAINYPTP